MKAQRASSSEFDPGLVDFVQRGTFVRGHVIGLVALNFVLRLVGRRVVGVALVVEIAGVHLGDMA